jgi:hypothetical protein
MKDKKALKIAAIFGAGAAAGVAIGILIASEKGSSFRDKIKRFMKEADGSLSSMEEKMEQKMEEKHENRESDSGQSTQPHS